MIFVLTEEIFTLLKNQNKNLELHRVLNSKNINIRIYLNLSLQTEKMQFSVILSRCIADERSWKLA